MNVSGPISPRIGKTIQESTPAWPAAVSPPRGAPNILVILFDDVGFSDFGRYGSPVATPTIADVRSRGYRIEAEVQMNAPGAEGVLIAHGDATCGYSLYVRDGRLVHDMNIGGAHVLVRSDRPVPPGRHSLGVRMQPHDGQRTATLLIDGAPAGSVTTPLGFVNFISWSGLDIGRDRGSPVSDYAAPFSFTGTLRRVTVTMDGDQSLDGDGIGRAEMARQ